MGNFVFCRVESEEEFKKILRQAQLDEFLKKIGCESAKILNSEASEIGYGIKPVKLKIRGEKCQFEEQVFETVWSLVNLAYYAILYTNDHRGLILNQEEFYLTLCAERDFSILVEDKKLKKMKKQDSKFYLYGFAGEQFKVQNARKVFANCSRELYILFHSAKGVDNQKIDLEEIIQKEVGMGWESFVGILFLLWFLSSRNPCLKSAEKNISWNEKISRKAFKRIINRYSVSYDEVRESKLGRQVLYVKPYVRSSRGETIAVNSFLSLFLCEHAVLWVVRDYYCRQGSQDFVSFFGKCFEIYFRDFLKTYLSENEYEKIQEESEKRADWILTLDNYKVLVEQKSALLRIGAKQQETDVETIKSFMANNVCEAMEQLEKTEKDFGGGPYTKIILLYEDYLDSHLVEDVFGLPQCKVKNDDNYWMVSIGEFEMFLHLYQSNKELFFEIFDEKIKREHNHSAEGKDLESIMRNHGIVKNEYIESEKFAKYRTIAEDVAGSVLHKD